jgi:hypothetical protein
MENTSRAEDESEEPNPFDAPSRTKPSPKKQEPAPTDEPGEEMDSLSYFQKLAEE